VPATGQKTALQCTAASSIKILYGESDEQTLSAQSAEMTMAGHHVTTALDRKGVTEALSRDNFELVIRERPCPRTIAIISPTWSRRRTPDQKF